MKVYWCKNCLNMSTRPRIEFDVKGICNACNWSFEKKKINWKNRKKELTEIFKKNKTSNTYDCIVPLSGGKDGTSIAHKIKYQLKKNPLCVTIRPPLELGIGKKNLDNFFKLGFDHVHVTPNASSMQKLNKIGLKYYGQPYYGWLISIHSAVARIAFQNNISLIVYAEDGELEYGGSTSNKNKAIYDTKYQKEIYLNNTYEQVIKKSNIKKSDLYWFQYPENVSKIRFIHWSYFEAWDSYKNYLYAKKNCHLEDNTKSNQGTFTNFAQNDQALYALHCYFMFLKFGFGRSLQDAGIEIRRGAMERNQAINLVNIYDSKFPLEFLDLYLDYYKITRNEFFKIVDRFANKKILKKYKNYWIPKFSII